MRAMLLVAALLALALPATAAPRDDHALPRVELLTMGPGDDVFAAFGHTALRVVRPAGHRTDDIVYNFGYTQFDSPDLIRRFLRGEARFWVATARFPLTLRIYGEQNRSVWRQELRLSPAQHRALAEALASNALPANRVYRYHHYRDNCSTRPRDLLDRVTGGAVQRALRGRPTGLTLRQLTRQGFADWLGLLLLTDLVLGRELDRPIDAWESGFLPRLLMQAVQQVELPGGQRLAGPPRTLFLRQGPSPMEHDAYRGTRLLWIASGLSVLAGLGLWQLSSRWRGRGAGVLLVPLALFAGVSGTLIWTLALVSSLPELRWNENLLLLWPTDLLLLWPAIRWLRGRPWAGRLLRGYAWARAGVTLVALVGHATGLLYQRPLAWLIISLSLSLGLLLSVRHMPRSAQPAASASEPSILPRAIEG